MITFTANYLYSFYCVDDNYTFRLHMYAYDFVYLDFISYII